MMIALLAGSFLARPAYAAELSAAEIVAKNVKARGGLDAWRKIETMVWIGHIESTHTSVPVVQFRLEQKRPNKTRMEINARGDRSLRVFDGAHGFRLRPARGRPEVKPFTPQEVRYAQTGSGIEGPLIDYAAKGASVTLEGVDEIAGHKAYHLNVHLAAGGSEEVWVNTETFLDVRHDRMADAPAGAPRRVSATFGDYRAVEGLQIPFLVETGGGSNTTPDKMQVERVVLNAPLDDSRFENPLAPVMRARARAKVEPRAPPPTAPPTAPTASDGRGAAVP